LLLSKARDRAASGNGEYENMRAHPVELLIVGGGLEAFPRP
jgi:hypothetical protein